MTKAKKPSATGRQLRIQQDIERCKNAKVICVNEPNPNLMRILAADIIDFNRQRLERELMEKKDHEQEK